MAIGLSSVAVVGDDDQHGAEDLLLGDAHGVVDVHEHGGLDEPALVDACGPAAADGHLGALLLADLDVALHPVTLALGHERPDLGGRVEGVAHLHGGHLLDQRVHDLLVAVARGEDAGLGDARLAVVHEGVGHEHGNGLGQVDVVEQHGRRLPAQLEAEALELLAADGADLLAGHRRTGERHLVDAGVANEVLAHLAAGGHHAQHALGQAGLFEELGQPEGVERCLGDGLEHHRAARHQRRGELGGGDEERHVPRR